MFRQFTRASALVGALALGLTGCGEAGTPGSTPTTGDTAGPTTPQETTSATPTDETTSATTSEDDMKTPKPVPVPTDDLSALPTGPVPESVKEREDVQEAVAAEAKRRDVPVDEVEVVGYAAVTWSDGSLGCPQPGMMYTMALVPGYQLVLSVDGQKASYHAAQGKPFNYCASPVAPAQTEATS